MFPSTRNNLKTLKFICKDILEEEEGENMQEFVPVLFKLINQMNDYFQTCAGDGDIINISKEMQEVNERIKKHKILSKEK